MIHPLQLEPGHDHSRCLQTDGATLLSRRIAVVPNLVAYTTCENWPPELRSLDFICTQMHTCAHEDTRPHARTHTNAHAQCHMYCASHFTGIVGELHALTSAGAEHGNISSYKPGQECTWERETGTGDDGDGERRIAADRQDLPLLPEYHHGYTVENHVACVQGISRGFGRGDESGTEEETYTLGLAVRLYKASTGGTNYSGKDKKLPSEHVHHSIKDSLLITAHL